MAQANKIYMYSPHSTFADGMSGLSNSTFKDNLEFAHFIISITWQKSTLEIRQGNIPNLHNDHDIRVNKLILELHRTSLHKE